MNTPETITQCAWTRKIRIDDDWVNQTRAFKILGIKDLRGQRVSHGICPEAKEAYEAAIDEISENQG